MLKAVVTVLILLALAFVSNPSAETHREKLKSEVASRSQLARVLHLGSVAALASTYHTVGIASYSTVADKKVTWGAFGFVFVPDLTEN